MQPVQRQVQQTYTQSIQVAASRGTTVHVIAASQTDDPAEHAFREIAQGTGADGVHLAEVMRAALPPAEAGER
jgi:hypothetical protein